MMMCIVLSSHSSLHGRGEKIVSAGLSFLDSRLPAPVISYLRHTNFNLPTDTGIYPRRAQLGVAITLLQNLHVLKTLSFDHTLYGIRLADIG